MYTKTFRSSKKTLILLFEVSNVFCLEMNQNNIFFKKIIFDIRTSKWSENTKKLLIWSKKIKINQFFSKTLLKRKNKQARTSKKNNDERCFLRLDLNLLMGPTYKTIFDSN
jgi:hypothetical protein